MIAPLAITFALLLAPQVITGPVPDATQTSGTVTVVVFLSARCPVSNAYGTRLQNLYNEYSSKGVRFLFVNSNSNETAAEMDVNARQHRFTFSIYQDSTSAAAIRFGAEFTPETYVLDTTGAVQYHGAIDDAQNPARVKSQSLKLAIDAVLGGRPAPAKETKAFGCTIKRPTVKASRN